MTIRPTPNYKAVALAKKVNKVEIDEILEKKANIVDVNNCLVNKADVPEVNHLLTTKADKSYVWLLVMVQVLMMYSKRNYRLHNG